MGNIVASVAPHPISFCTFRAGMRLCGVDVQHVREISTQVSSTPVPHAPAVIRGLVNLRSRIHLVADLRPVFGLDPVVPTPDSRLIIFKERIAEGLGVLVDQVGDIVRASPSQVETSLADSRQAEHDVPTPHHVVCGVCKLEGELMLIVDPMELVAFIEAAMR